MARWALTGAGGYIGRHFANHLLERGEVVRGLYHASAPGDGIEAISGSILDPDAIARLVLDADVVVHLAAFVHRRAGSKAQQRDCTQLNVQGTQVVAEAARKAGARLIQVSTANVYPPAPFALDEHATTAPRTLYGETKLAAEQIVTNEKSRGLRAIILRPAMVIGANAPGNLPRLVRMVRRGLVPLLGAGANKKTMTSVIRLCHTLTFVGTHDVQEPVLNVGGLTLTMKSVIELIGEELGKHARVVSVPSQPLAVMARVADVVTRGLRLPSFKQMVESFASTSALDDTLLESLAGFHDPSSSIDELRAAIRSFSA
jgi:nucleoside-diphosphate-sugar epimerase